MQVARSVECGAARQGTSLTLVTGNIAMSMTATKPCETEDRITVKLPEPLDTGWNRVHGITVAGDTLTIDPDVYFFRYEKPSWIVCDWDQVRDELLSAAESEDSAAEQMTLDFVKAHGARTTNPVDVLHTAHEVYSHIFRQEHLGDSDLGHVTPRHLRMLREMATLMALNRVELDGRISTIGPAWFFPATSRVVYELDTEQSEVLDDLYHGTFFNEYRRIESVKAHAALGGRLVHGCQSRPNMSGGCVVAYGTDLDRFRTELTAFKGAWIEQILAGASPR
jgi:hypothetical protein